MFNVIFIPCSIYYSRLSSTSHATLRMETYMGLYYPFRVVMLFLYVVFKFMFYFMLSPKGAGSSTRGQRSRVVRQKVRGERLKAGSSSLTL